MKNYILKELDKSNLKYYEEEKDVNEVNYPLPKG